MELTNEKLMEFVRNAMQNQQGLPEVPNIIPSALPSMLSQIPTQPMPQMPVVIQTSQMNDVMGDQMLKASPSASSDMSSLDSDVADHPMTMMMQQQQDFQNPLQQLTIDSSANIAAGVNGNTEQRSSGRHETWLECFNTTKFAEYEALLFSVYVAERTDRKYDGWTYFDCLHRLQSKCRYRVRAKKQDEFYIIEEKGVHNHGAVEPVGQAGSHAGLPKTIREIVDRSYNENWPVEARTIKVDEEIQRLGLPENPRLGRQIDNRLAYLRRVKNLHETRRIQDQVNGTMVIKDPVKEAMLQALMEQNGGQLTVGQGFVDQIIANQGIPEMPIKKEEPTQPVESMEMAEQVAKPLAMNPSPDFFQFLQNQKLSHEHEQQQQQLHAAILAQAQAHAQAQAQAQQNLMESQKNIHQ
ncbi:FLYWCH-type domain-containing protein [Caenorhabditis elegans]|nr:FLYWCH-type domain-containing protein [Caenorhabditis elegans]CAV31783.1 FLYWCH-type domain-containing protein [Caenorhabditis elegans]|eukprot:NP_001254134.1 Uncharacterized protein CELE_T05H10.4 [Caenorhabditis elegans]